MSRPPTARAVVVPHSRRATRARPAADRAPQRPRVRGHARSAAVAVHRAQDGAVRRTVAPHPHHPRLGAVHGTSRARGTTHRPRDIGCDRARRAGLRHRRPAPHHGAAVWLNLVSAAPIEQVLNGRGPALRQELPASKASARTTWRLMMTHTDVPVYPRARGRPSAPRCGLDCIGPSPRARGRLLVVLGGRLTGRFIPASAGATLPELGLYRTRGLFSFRACLFDLGGSLAIEGCVTPTLRECGS